MSGNRKLNCWEFKNCGREPEGQRVADLGACPAATEKRLDGAHEGRNAGRACWVIAETVCHEKIPRTFFEKYRTCVQCDFYNNVRKEEGSQFILTSLLLQKIRD